MGNRRLRLRDAAQTNIFYVLEYPASEIAFGKISIKSNT